MGKRNALVRDMYLSYEHFGTNSMASNSKWMRLTSIG
jgi:hypothetical protein